MSTMFLRARYCSWHRGSGGEQSDVFVSRARIFQWRGTKMERRAKKEIADRTWVLSRKSKQGVAIEGNHVTTHAHGHKLKPANSSLTETEANHLVPLLQKLMSS